MRNIKKDFKKEFDDMILRIDSKQPLAFARYADGECALMRNFHIRGCDGWDGKSNSRLGRDLIQTLNHIEENYFYGISCRCCDINSYEYLTNLIKQNDTNITYSNLFVNGNYQYFKNWLTTVKEDIVMIASEDGVRNLPFENLKIISYTPVPIDVVYFWETKADKYKEFLNQFVTENNTLFLISAGPMSEVIIDHLYKINNTNRYIDVGSSIDEIVHKRMTRPYMVEGSPYYGQICQL